MALSPPITILNVDDREINRYARSRVLRQAGFEVKEAATGYETLQVVRQDRPPLVLLDVHLPDIDGLEVCQQIKSDPDLASTLVLQISASLTTGTDKARGLEGGADAYLIEPVEPAELIASVKALLRLWEAQQALKQAVARTTQLQNVTAALSEALAPAQVAEVVIREGIPGLGAKAGSVILLSEDGETLQVISSIGYPPEQIERWSAFPVTALIPIADAVRLGEPILLSSLAEIQVRYPHLVANLQPHHLAWAAIPLLVEDQTIGAMGLSFAESHTFGPEELEYMLILAGQCAQALERARLYEAEARMREEAEVARLHLAVLAEAGKRLALSLDEEATLTQLRELIVPAFADLCFTDLLVGTKTIRRALYAGTNFLQAQLEHPYELHYPVDPHDPNHPVLQVIRTNEARLIPEITETLLPAFAYPAEQLALLRQLGLTSGMIVPLTAQGCTFGAVSFIWAGSHRRYDAADLILAKDLANRAALALNNAHLYKQALTEIAERKRADEEFRAVALFPNENPNPVLRISREGIILYANPSSQKWLETWKAQIGSHAPQTWKEIISRVLQTGQLEEFEIDIGSKVFAVTCRPFSELGHVNLYGYDITQRKKAEAALRLSEERFAKIFRMSPEAIIITRQNDGQVLEVNHRWEELLGHSRDEAIRQTAFGLNLYVNLADRQRLVEQLQQTGAVYDLELDIRLKSGETRQMNILAETIVIHDEPCLLSIVRDITERKRAEAVLQAALAEAEEGKRTLEALLEYVPEGITIADALDVKIRHVSRYGQELLGGPHQDLTAMQVAEQWKVYEADGVTPLPEAHLPLVRAIQTGETIRDQELIQVNTQGHRLSLLCNAAPIRDQAGQIVAGIVAWRDISERKRVENELIISENNLATSQAIANVGSYSWDLDKNLLVWSDELYRILGLIPKQIQPAYDTYTNFIHPDDRAEAIRKIRQAVEEGKTQPNEHRILRTDGSVRVVEVQSRVWREHKDKRGIIYGIVQDITERKQTETALRESEEKLKTLFNLLPVGVSILNEELRVLMVNPALERILDVSEAGLFRGDYKKRAYLRTDGIPMPLEEFPSIRAIKEQQIIENVEIGAVTESGAIIWTNVSAKPLPFADWRVVVITSDITERKLTAVELQRARDAAEAASRAKSDFLARMSHELRTPLNAILGYTQIFKRDRTLTLKQQEGIEIMHQSGEHLLQMITDILDMAKVEADKVELQPTPVSLPRFLRVLTEMVRVRADQKGLTFIYQLDPALPGGICVDEKRLREVLLNLLSNAIKYTKAGRVELLVTQVSSSGENGVNVRFQVSDTGIGIASEALAEIFTPFYQGGDFTSHPEGTGLGLAISHRLVELMGGELQVKSTPGQGSAFWFDLVLPVVPVEEPILEETSPAQTIVGFKGGPFKILIVDDQGNNRLLLRDLLLNLGFIVTEAANGEEAVKHVSLTSPDLILMDLVMPVMDGFAAIRQIRQRPAPNHIPIIAISASVSGNIRELCRTAGADEFLTKPIQLESLFACLKTYLKLEWLYSPLPPQAADRLAEHITALVLPPVEDLLEVRALAEGGQVTALERFLSQISEADEAYGPVVEQLSRLADHFEFSQIMSLIDQYLERGSM